MLDMKKSVALRIDKQIGWLELDLEGEKVNKFSKPVLIRFKKVLEEIKINKEIKALIIISKKPRIYIAGADINEIKKINTKKEFLKAVESGQGLMNSFEDLAIPTIAAINGACVGGGCEFALACDYRIASDDRFTKIGLPETQLGIIPGFGGCIRLPRVIGLVESLGLILTGRLIPAVRAKKIGLVDKVYPMEIFEKKVKEFTLNIIKKGAKKRKKQFSGKGIAKFMQGPFLRNFIYSGARKNIMKVSKGHYPAPLEALSVIKDTYGSSNREKLLKREAKGFLKVATTDISKNLINIFFITEDIKKATGVLGPSVKPKKVSHISVLGAGTMGGGIAQLAADKGIVVRMKDISLEALALGFKAAATVWNKKVKRKRMTKYDFTQKMNHLSGGLDFSGFANTDLVIEAIVENMDIKKTTILETVKNLKPDAIMATNTSSLSVNEMAKAHPNPKQFVGMHFFNPVDKMPLVEIIRGKETSDEVVATTFKLAKNMGKFPVVVNDGPGFLVNRLLLPWLAEALFLLDDGMDVVKVDRMYTHTFGMPMGPYRLMDEVGLDVCVKVLKIFKTAFSDRIETSNLVKKLEGLKRLGKKNRLGFYKYDSKGKQSGFDPTVYSELGLGSRKNSLSEEECITRGIFTMVNEASRALLEDKIVQKPHEVDLAMIMGAGFPPFRGGLLKYADKQGLKEIISQLEIYESKYGKRFNPADSLVALAQSEKTFYSSL